MNRTRLLLLLLPFCCLSAFAGGKARIVFQETEFVFTENYLGETSEHVFTFKNEGDAPLIVTDAVPSCGCVKPSWTKSPVAPGETGEIHVYYTSKMSGAFHKTIKVYSNSAGKRPTLTIKGETHKR